jgi:hypothetical protein
MREIVAFPVSLLGWLGILSTTTARSIAESALFRMLGGVAALIGFASAVVGLITGWAQFVTMVSSWIAKL